MNVKKHVSAIGWSYAAFFAFSTGAQFAIGFLLSFFPGLSIDMNQAMVLSQLSMYLTGFPVFHLMMKRIPSWKARQDNKLMPSELVIWLLFCFGITYLGNFLGQFLMYAVETVTNRPIESPVEAMVQEMNLPVVFLSTVVIAPVMEEVMFRKYLIDRIVPLGQKTAILVSGIGFGLFHGNFYQFFYACGIGMVFAYLYSKTGRIRYCILLHMLINFMGGIVPMLILQGIQGRGAGSILWLLGQSVFMFGSIIAAIVLWFSFVQKQPLFPGWMKDHTVGIGKAILLAPGIWVGVAITVILFTLNFLI